ncbi:testis-specific serine/threonine-protein kinase 2-like [Oppia nitens]|uniref:testis-specific serine/threonine-protein kinase 2-like n=1 Tax=Oppia nitens TaxID=1686743 RepID=UPI0023DAC75E|nr:testis-specific serine/threonine-protein kinase 2-like [Oppia nitens]
MSKSKSKDHTETNTEDELTNEAKKFLDEEYHLKIIKFLGSGAYSKVYKAVDYDKVGYAIKVIEMDKQDEDIRTEFIPRELQILSDVQDCCHPNIMMTFGYQPFDNYLFIFCELADGGDLISVLDKTRDTDLDPQIIQQWYYQIASAVNHLHLLGIAHRDIKPDNVIICNGTAKLCDFGHAIYGVKYGSNGSYEMVMTDHACGTLEYEAPEVIACELRNESYDAFIADSYSMGVVLYLMVTHDFPYNCENIDVDKTDDMDYHYNRVMNSEWTIEQKYKTDRLLLDLLTHLLEPSPLQRLHVFEILNHSWLSSDVSNNTWSLFGS